MADYRAMNRNSKVVDARKKLAATFSTPAPKVSMHGGHAGVTTTPNPVFGDTLTKIALGNDKKYFGGVSGPVGEATGAEEFVNRLFRNMTVDAGDAVSRIKQDTFMGGKGKSSLIANGDTSLVDLARNPSATIAGFVTNNAVNNEDVSQAVAPGDLMGLGGLLKGAAKVGAKVVKPIVPVVTSKVGKAASAASAAIAASGFANSDAAQAVPVSGVTKAGGLLTHLPRGAFENPRLGLKALTEIITGDPTQTSFVAQNYRTLAKLAMGGEASLRGVDDVAETQVKHWANTGRSGFERASNWLDIPFPQLGRFIDQGEASVNDLYKEVSGRPISFGSPKPTVEAVAKGLNERRLDLGPLSSSFGAINNPKAITQGFRSAVTAGKEHIAGSAYQGANIAGQVLGAGNEAANIDELIPLMEKLVKHGAAALDPSELILVDAAFNSNIKGTLPYEIARPIGLAKGGLTMARQLGDDALTHKSYVSFIDKMGKLDSNLVDVNRMEKFAKEIKPKVKFAEKSFGAAKNAFDPSNTLVDTRRQLGEWLASM